MGRIRIGKLSTSDASLRIDNQKLAINDESRLQIELQTVGKNEYPLLIVDNLYQHPESVRQIALSLQYRSASTAHPGYHADISADETLLLRLLQDQIGGLMGYTFDSLLRSCEAVFRFFLIQKTKHDLRLVQCKPHCDSRLLAAIVYLNPPEQCRGGTAFYRHRATGVEELVGFDPTEVLGGQYRSRMEQGVVRKHVEMGLLSRFEQLQAEGFVSGYAQLHEQITSTPVRVRDYITDSNDEWELTRLVEMRWNRLIAYPGYLLHSGYLRDEWFPQTRDTQRLTQNLSFAWPANAVQTGASG